MRPALRASLSCVVRLGQYGAWLRAKGKNVMAAGGAAADHRTLETGLLRSSNGTEMLRYHHAHILRQ